ncbi:phosphatidylserine decarboxylase [Rossellomorea vietnamensis]|uniref:phosphatidylserine decarboxylase n=1 Tax=Rossellomorea vietnamensis TaxID=218284 RepID=A0A5D4MGQ9_9BACI|nr:phosphatidylserine decarboxylase [Rossellomorea vietnamensis]TYS00832.1 phosphatidylserine decarboxylase [Rossellomorea vietnamensis]
MRKFFYRSFIELTNKRWTSFLLRRFVQSGVSARFIPSYIKTYKINIDEVEKEAAAYPDLHSFFIRNLKEGMRRIEGAEDDVVSPVDGMLADTGTVSKALNMKVKGKDYSIEEMLGSKEKAEVYEGGQYMILYLSPADYHRIHSPLSGKVIERWELGRHSYPVNELGLQYGVRTLAKNFRSMTEVDYGTGKMCLAKVGAMFVNSIEYTHEGEKWEKGEEIGYFSFGSTVILLFEKGNFHLKEDLKVPGKVKMGGLIGKISRN